MSAVKFHQLSTLTLHRRSPGTRSSKHIHSCPQVAQNPVAEATFVPLDTGVRWQGGLTSGTQEPWSSHQLRGPNGGREGQTVRCSVHPSAFPLPPDSEQSCFLSYFQEPSTPKAAIRPEPLQLLFDVLFVFVTGLENNGQKWGNFSF